MSVRTFLFQRRKKLVSGGSGGGGGDGGGGGLNNFLKAARCLGLLKCFKIFHFN